MVASVAGFAGLVMSAWVMGAIMPLPPPDGEPLWEPLVFLSRSLTPSCRPVLSLCEVHSPSLPYQ